MDANGKWGHFKMKTRKIRALGFGYSAEVDGVHEAAWGKLMQQFEDCNINQTWAFGMALSGQQNLSHLIVRFRGEIASIAQVRIKRVPILGSGVAYVSWGPMWRRIGARLSVENFRQAVRALRNEFVCKRGLTLRVFPLAFADEASELAEILAEEGLACAGREESDRTLLMDLSPSLPQLRESMEKNWRRCLRHAENGDLKVVEGTEEELFDEFIQIYRQMISRKMFAGSLDYKRLKEIQARLPDELKMKVMLCKSNEGVCAGLIASLMGKMGIDLFAATSNIGTRSNASYLLRWKMLENLKAQGAVIHNLNGINPADNPGTYRFKRGMAGRQGRDTYYLGKFDANPGVVGYALMELGDSLRKGLRESLSRFAEARARVAHAYYQYVWRTRTVEAENMAAEKTHNVAA